jgi:hypothetical protein
MSDLKFAISRFDFVRSDFDFAMSNLENGTSDLDFAISKPEKPFLSRRFCKLRAKIAENTIFSNNPCQFPAKGVKRNRQSGSFKRM